MAKGNEAKELMALIKKKRRATKHSGRVNRKTYNDDITPRQTLPCRRAMFMPIVSHSRCLAQTHSSME